MLFFQNSLVRSSFWGVFLCISKRGGWEKWLLIVGSNNNNYYCRFLDVLYILFISSSLYYNVIFKDEPTFN